MRRLLRFCVLLVLLCAVPHAPAQDNQPQESGPLAILLRSQFAAGYLNGYEHSYHQGNLDANMARLPKTKLSQFKMMRRGHASSSGSKKFFEAGFIAGLKAGYGDGYFGRVFRAVSQLREAGSALGQPPLQAAPAGENFDTGMAAGYEQGFDNGLSNSSSRRHLDPHTVSCQQSSSGEPQDSTGEKTYCAGFRSGFVLGDADGAARQLDSHLLEASE
jgi:hypothetical protein